jgi:hypothetical protein
MLPAVVDKVVLGLLVASFATLVTTHLAIALRLTWRVRPRYRGLIALVIVPMAPIWAWGQRWTRLTLLWIGGVVVYAIALTVALA